MRHVTSCRRSHTGQLYRSRLPDPEDLFDDGRGAAPPPSPRSERVREPRHALEAGGGAWFQMPVGRRDNADPKWLVPLICRLGHVTKKDIGEIRIFDHDTRFEIAPAAEARFREALRHAVDGEVPITPAGAPGPRAAGPGGPKPRSPARGRPAGKGGPPRRGPRPGRAPNGGRHAP